MTKNGRERYRAFDVPSPSIYVCARVCTCHALETSYYLFIIIRTHHTRVHACDVRR